MKLQVAVDFLSSYGIALVIIFIAFAAIYSIALSPNNPAVFCTPNPGFDCAFVSINASGVMTAKLSQATGTEITINGIACSSQQSSSADVPAFGNTGVSSSISYYPSQYYPPGNSMYSGSSYVFRMYCYSSSSGVATGKTGTPFTGYIWLNYTVPNYGSVVQKVAVFSTVYS